MIIDPFLEFIHVEVLSCSCVCLLGIRPFEALSVVFE